MTKEEKLIDTLLRIRVDLRTVYFFLVYNGYIGTQSRTMSALIKLVDSTLQECGALPDAATTEEPKNQQSL